MQTCLPAIHMVWHGLPEAIRLPQTPLLDLFSVPGLNTTEVIRRSFSKASDIRKKKRSSDVWKIFPDLTPGTWHRKVVRWSPLKFLNQVPDAENVSDQKYSFCLALICVQVNQMFRSDFFTIWVPANDRGCLRIPVKAIFSHFEIVGNEFLTVSGYAIL